MAGKRHTPQQVINKLREAEGSIAEGSTAAEVARRIGVTGRPSTAAQRENRRIGTAAKRNRAGWNYDYLLKVLQNKDAIALR